MKDSSFFTTLSLPNKLLLASTHATIVPTEISSIINNTIQNECWNSSIEMAYHHAVIPQLYRASKQYISVLPKEKQNFIATANREIALENMKLSAELIMIIKVLEENRLDYISIKGPTLSQQLYQDITIRQICDLDILVNEKDLLKIAKLLQTLGYAPNLPLSLLGNRGFIARDNDFTFLHPTKKIMIELHWKLFPDRHKMPLDFTTLYQHATQINIQDKSIKVLSNEHNLLYLSLHASKHVFEQLKWVCDLDKLIRNTPDLDIYKVCINAQERNVLEPFILALLVAHNLYDTPLPRSFFSFITPTTETLLAQALNYFKEDFTTLDEPTKKRIRFIFLQELNQNKQNKFVALFISLFKPSSVDYIYFQLPTYLDFLYPILRPVRLLYKYVIKKQFSN